MTIQSISQIEEEFGRLSAGEQLFLLERLAERIRLGDATHDASSRRTPEILATRPKLLGELDRSELQSAAADLLSETW